MFGKCSAAGTSLTPSSSLFPSVYFLSPSVSVCPARLWRAEREFGE